MLDVFDGEAFTLSAPMGEFRPVVPGWLEDSDIELRTVDIAQVRAYDGGIVADDFPPLIC